MKKQFSSIFKIIVMVLTVSFMGYATVDAADTIQIKSSENKHGASIFTTTSGQRAYCMIKGISSPPKNKTMKLAATWTKGPVVYIVNDTSISGSGDTGQIIRQKALWAYLSSLNSKTHGSYSISGDYKDKAKKLLDAAKKAGSNYTINPTITSLTTPTMTKSGANYTSQKLTVGLKDVKNNSYSVSFSGAPTGTKVINKSGKTFQVQVPVANVTKTTSFTVKVTGAKSPYKVVKQYHYDHKAHNTSRRQDMGVLVSTDKTPTKSVTAKVTYQTCHVVGNTYYGSKGTVVTVDQYYAQCNPKCTVKNGKYYNKVGKPVTQAEYYKDCNPKCTVKDGKYYDNNGKPVTETEYYKACNPKCSVKDGKYYDNNGKPVTETEFYQICNPKCVEDKGKYYDNNGKPVTQEEFYKVCNPMCEEKDGKYYDIDHKPVTKEEYYLSCNPKCEVKDGKYYNEVGAPVSEAEYYLACNPKCTAVDGKYYDQTGKPVDVDTYLKACFPVTPNPTPAKAVDTELVRYEKNYHYTITHEVPHRVKVDFYKSYVFTDVLEPPLQIKSTDDVKIYQQSADSDKKEDWTNKFEIKIDGQKITATLKDPSEVAFYGTRDPQTGAEVNKKYSYVLTVSLRDNAETKFDMTKYKGEEEDSYIIPDVAHVTMINAAGQTEEQETNLVEVKYQLAPKPTKNVDKSDVTDSYVRGTKYNYSILKQVPAYKGNQKYSSFVFKDVFEAPIQLTSPKDLMIKNENGEDVTNWFDVKTNYQTLTASLKKEYNTDSFYGHIYTFVATVNLKMGYNLDKYKQGDRFVIPNYATFSFDDKIEKTDVVDVYVKIENKVIKTPDTASTASVLGIAGGVLLILGAAYALAVKSGIDPLGLYKNETVDGPRKKKDTSKKETHKE